MSLHSKVVTLFYHDRSASAVTEPAKKTTMTTTMSKTCALCASVSCTMDQYMREIILYLLKNVVCGWGCDRYRVSFVVSIERLRTEGIAPHIFADTRFELTLAQLKLVTQSARLIKFGLVLYTLPFIKSCTLAHIQSHTHSRANTQTLHTQQQNYT